MFVWYSIQTKFVVFFSESCETVPLGYMRAPNALSSIAMRLPSLWCPLCFLLLLLFVCFFFFVFFFFCFVFCFVFVVFFSVLSPFDFCMYCRQYLHRGWRFGGCKINFSRVMLNKLRCHAHAGLGGSVGCADRLETRRSRVQPPPRSATFFRGD